MLVYEKLQIVFLVAVALSILGRLTIKTLSSHGKLALTVGGLFFLFMAIAIKPIFASF